jgi:DNA invertase Pin-like site-specific DNA recombinase
MPRRSAICDCDMFSKNRSVSRVRSRSGTREGDAIVVIGIDRLGRNAAEVMTTIRELAEHGIVLRSLREGIDTSNATGRMVAGELASLAELELELGRERRSAARERVGHAGSTSEDRRHSIYPKQLWPSACTRAVSLRARLRRPSA